MTTNEVATMPNYITLASEVALCAYNDYIRYSIDLYTLEHPSDSDHTVRRYEHLKSVLLFDIKRRLERGGKRADERRVISAFYEELPYRENVLRGKIKICERFFSDPNPLAAYLGLNDEVLPRADEAVDRWIKTGKLNLLKSVRGEQGRKGYGSLEECADQ